MGKHNPSTAQGGMPAYPWRFGNIGRDDVNKEYDFTWMPCPSQKRGFVFLGCGKNWTAVREQTYNVNYPDVFGFQWDPSTPKGLRTAFNGSAMLDEVTGADLITVQQSFGNAGASPLQGDANDDGQVTGSDLIAVQQNFGNVANPAAAPEPAATAIFVLAGLISRKRAKRHAIRYSK